jgi:hypothetical protein
MSFLSLAGQIGTVAQAVQALTGKAAVTIGSVALQGTEVPAKMPWGGDQKTVIHDLVGGGRQVDVLGRFDRDIQWSGLFNGVDAISRALALDAIKNAGAPVTLTWGTFNRQVVIKTFEPDYGSDGMMVSYSITCLVIPSVQLTAAPTLLSQLGSDISSAIGVPNLGATVSTALTTAQSALPIAGVLIGGSKAFQTLSSAVTSAQTVTSAAQGAAGSTLSSISGAASASGAIFGSTSALAQAVSASGVEATATEALSYVSRAATNLTI